MLRLHRLFAPVALGAAALLLALLALGDKMHLLAVGLGDALGDYALVEAAQQLLDRLSLTSLDFHACATRTGTMAWSTAGPHATMSDCLVLTSPRVSIPEIARQYSFTVYTGIGKLTTENASLGAA